MSEAIEEADEGLKINHSGSSVPAREGPAKLGLKEVAWGLSEDGLAREADDQGGQGDGGGETVAEFGVPMDGCTVREPSSIPLEYFLFGVAGTNTVKMFIFDQIRSLWILIESFQSNIFGAN